MFQNAYQGGSNVEIYDAKVNKEKEKSYANLYRMTTPQGFSKIFDKDIKGYLYCIDGHSTKMRFPKDDKVDLCIVQPFLVLQIYLPFGSPWSLEIGIADTSKVNRRINLVSALNKIETKYFHVKVPNDIIKRGIWLNLSIDVNSFMDAWKGQTFRSIDNITIGSVCKLRRVFSMKNPLFEFTSDEYQDDNDEMNLQQSVYSHLKPEDIPKNFAFPPGFQYTNQSINYQKIMDNVDPKYLESVSDSMDNMKTNQPYSSISKTMHKNQDNNTLMKSAATKQIKNSGNNSYQKQIPDLTQDFPDKQPMGLRIDVNKNNNVRMDRSPPSVQSSQQQNNSKFTSSTKRETSISSINNLEEEYKQVTTQTKNRNRQASKEPVRQSLSSQKPPQPQVIGNVQQQQKNIPKSPINQSLKSPLNSQKDLSQQSNSRQPSKNQQRQPLNQKKELAINSSQKNNPWFVNSNKASKKLFEDQNEEIEENLEAEYYDKFEIDEELPQTIKKKDSKIQGSTTQQKSKVNVDKNLKDGTNQDRIPPSQTKSLLKDKAQTQQIQRNVKSANNFGKKPSLLDPKKVKDANKKVDVQKNENKVNQKNSSENECLDNPNAFNSMNTDIDEESYFQLTQKFNTVSDPNQFRDIFTMSNQKAKKQEEDSYGNNNEYENDDDFGQNEIEENIETEHFNSPSGVRKGGQSKVISHNQNQNKNTQNTKVREYLKQDTVESRKYQTNKDNQHNDSAEKNKFDDSLEGPYIQRNLNNYNNNDEDEGNYDDELHDKYSSAQKDDQGNNNSLHNYNIYENHLNKFINNSQRPFTPPFQAVVPLQGSSIITKKNNQTVVIQNQMSDEHDQRHDNKSSVSNKNKKNSPSHHNNNNSDNDQEQLEVIYDPVLNCYYDPNTKQYYELKS